MENQNSNQAQGQTTSQAQGQPCQTNCQNSGKVPKQSVNRLIAYTALIHLAMILALFIALSYIHAKKWAPARGTAAQQNQESSTPPHSRQKNNLQSIQQPKNSQSGNNENISRRIAAAQQDSTKPDPDGAADPNSIITQANACISQCEAQIREIDTALKAKESKLDNNTKTIATMHYTQSWKLLMEAKSDLEKINRPESTEFLAAKYTAMDILIKCQRIQKLCEAVTKILSNPEMFKEGGPKIPT